MNHRLFISISIPDEIKKEIANIQNKLPDFKGKKSESENLHLTLKFLGEVEEKKIHEIKQKLDEIKIKKFNSSFLELGVFNPEYIRIIWVSLNHCDELQKNIEDKLKDFFSPEKIFMSHLTIARIKNIKNKKRFLQELKKIKFDKLNFEVNKFYLMESELTIEGSKYKIISEYPLI